MITRQQASDLFKNDDLISIGMEADALRGSLHPESIVSYCMDSDAMVAVQFDADGPMEQWLNRLQEVRDVHEETGQFNAIMPVFKQEVSGVEYLKLLAISRLYWDNILHVQTSWTMGGLKLCQIALRFGANDICGRSASSPTEEDLRRVIREAGFNPKQRDALFRSYSLG
jgi:cyclic dehypoxanthinyl futalosine synthase